MGYIHSIESFGTVDGPGVRFVVFFQGCPMRCQYCHNPDSWHLKDGTEMSVEEILDRFERNRGFYRNGGITATGGEPMVQMDFLISLFMEAKERGVHTCLDTSGILFPPDKSGPIFEKVTSLLSVTDLILLDIKHIDDVGHQALTGKSNRPVLAFAKYLSEIKKPVWIRHVVVPGITFDKQQLTNLGKFLKTLDNVEKIEVLPYHSMGKIKYESLGYAYPLADTPQLTKKEAKEAEDIIREAMKPEN